jgi:hypothetical protein
MLAPGYMAAWLEDLPVVTAKTEPISRATPWGFWGSGCGTLGPRPVSSTWSSSYLVSLLPAAIPIRA